MRTIYQQLSGSRIVDFETSQSALGHELDIDEAIHARPATSSRSEACVEPDGGWPFCAPSASSSAPSPLADLRPPTRFTSSMAGLVAASVMLAVLVPTAYTSIRAGSVGAGGTQAGVVKSVALARNSWPRLKWQLDDHAANRDLVDGWVPLSDPAAPSPKSIPETDPAAESDATTSEPWQGMDCRAVENDVEFWTAQALFQMEFVMSWELCQDKCERMHECNVWAWGDGGSGSTTAFVCYLRKFKKGDRLWRVSRRGLHSGVPCREKHAIPENVDKASRQEERPHDNPELNDARDVLGDARAHSSSGSMFCWALFRQNTYEQRLLKMQYIQNASLFGCDAYELYTNRIFELIPGLRTKFIDSDLACPIGGKYKTALNMPIFVKAWRAVISSGLYARHYWTVKVDADSVFFPERLLPILAKHQAGGDDDFGVYLNNCKYGLHGPIEVLSKNAVRVWGKGMHKCRHHFHRKCGGPCAWGEDMFIDKCLNQVLHSRRENEYGILYESHCSPPQGWDKCLASNVVVFHPFKNKTEYLRCWIDAKNSDKNENRHGRG